MAEHAGVHGMHGERERVNTQSATSGGSGSGTAERLCQHREHTVPVVYHVADSVTIRLLNFKMFSGSQIEDVSFKKKRGLRRDLRLANCPFQSLSIGGVGPATTSR